MALIKVNLANGITGTLPSANASNGWVEIASASNDDASTHVLSLDFSTYNIIKVYWSAGITSTTDSLVWSVSTDNFSSVKNLDGMYSYFQLNNSGTASNGNVGQPNDGNNEQYIKITANQIDGDNVFGESVFKGGTFHSNGNETRRNQFFFRHDCVTHQGATTVTERVNSHGQIARALGGSESTTPTHCRWHEIGGANIEFSYRQFGLKTS